MAKTSPRYAGLSPYIYIYGESVGEGVEGKDEVNRSVRMRIKVNVSFS